MPERTVNQGETVLQSLSFASSLLIVQTAPARFECRGCISLAIDCTKTAKLLGPLELLAHLDEHLKAGDNGAKDAIWKIEACGSCRGAGRLFPAKGSPTSCEACGGDGKNSHGKERGVRRGVIVPAARENT